MAPRSHTVTTAIRNLNIAIILASALGTAPAAQPPANLAKMVASRETASAEARLNYTYRQEVETSEFDRRGRPGGRFEETREVIFSPESGRVEKVTKGPINSLRFLALTDEDFHDIREVQPFLFTAEQLWAYETKYRGTEIIEGKEYFVLQVRPRQVFQGLRYFDGLLWIDPEDLAVARSYGQAVPPIFKGDSENIFPHFTTIRQKVDEHWFPVHTHVDDTLPFRNGPVRIRMTIRYSDYRRFSAESTVRFSDPE